MPQVGRRRGISRLHAEERPHQEREEAGVLDDQGWDWMNIAPADDDVFAQAFADIATLLIVSTEDLAGGGAVRDECRQAPQCRLLVRDPLAFPCRPAAR